MARSLPEIPGGTVGGLTLTSPPPHLLPMTLLKRIDLPLAGIVAAATVFISYWSLQVDQWGLMTDELLYSKLALNWGPPRVRGKYFAQFTPVYPVLIAPVVALFDMPTAFKAAHFINALLLASAAIPAFLIAHRVAGSRGIAYLVAAISVVVPWVVYANMLITESAAYPVFLWTILAILRAVEEPSARRDVIAIAAVGFATLTRTQFAILGVVLVLAALTHDLAYRPAWFRARPRGCALWSAVRDSGRNHVALLVAVVIGIVALAALEVAGGLRQGAGQYGNTLTGDLLPHGVSRSFRAHLAVIAANIAVVPLMLAIAWGLAALVRSERKTEHAFALVLGFTVVAVVLESASVRRSQHRARAGALRVLHRASDRDGRALLRGAAAAGLGRNPCGSNRVHLGPCEARLRTGEQLFVRVPVLTTLLDRSAADFSAACSATRTWTGPDFFISGHRAGGASPIGALVQWRHQPGASRRFSMPLLAHCALRRRLRLRASLLRRRTRRRHSSAWRRCSSASAASTGSTTCCPAARQAAFTPRCWATSTRLARAW